MCVIIWFYSAIRVQLSATSAKRYDLLRRTRFSHTTIKYLLQQLCATNKIPSNLPSVLADLGKIFVGQIVEESRIVMHQMNHSGPIRPVHLREAWRRLRNRGEIDVTHRQAAVKSTVNQRTTLFRR